MIWFDLGMFDMIRNSNKKGHKTPNENKWKQHLILFDLIWSHSPDFWLGVMALEKLLKII